MKTKCTRVKAHGFSCVGPVLLLTPKYTTLSILMNAGTIVGGLVSGDEQRILAGLPGSLVDAKGLLLTINGPTRVAVMDETSCGPLFRPQLLRHLEEQDVNVVGRLGSDDSEGKAGEGKAGEGGGSSRRNTAPPPVAAQGPPYASAAHVPDPEKARLLRPELGFTVSCMARGPSYHGFIDAEAE